MRLNSLKSTLLLGAALFLSPLISNAGVIYENWTSNDPGTGNYIVTVEHNVANETWDISFTVDPWNAEGLGVFIDLGDFTLTDAVVLTNISWAPPVILDGDGVTLFAQDTTSDSCGPGCNLNGLAAILPEPDGEWEMVFRLAGQGFDGIQTFNWSINDSALAGITDADWGLMGVRAQQLCPEGSLLPEGSCGGSDKSYGTGGASPPEGPGEPIPVPGTLALLGLGLLGLGRRQLRTGRSLA